MANGNKPDFYVYVTEKRDEKVFYTRIGAAWHVANDGISLRLQALPINGDAVMFPPRENDDER